MYTRGACAFAERSRSLEEKEKTIVELRNNNRTLENFRYVLDHRLKQLMEERSVIYIVYTIYLIQTPFVLGSDKPVVSA